MKVFCCQFDIAWENKSANFEKVEKLLARESPPAGSLVVLPEMCFTGFSMNVPIIANGEPLFTEAYLSATAKRHGVYLIAGLVTQAPTGRGKNEAVYVTPQGSVDGRFQKLHLFSPAGEDSFFEAGTRPITFSYHGVLVAPFICYDLRFPECFRAAVDLGAELCVVIANWPRVRESHWLTLLQARAIENQAFVAAVNRCGNDPQNEYSGRSVIISPTGEMLADAGEDECVIGGDLNWAELERVPSAISSADTPEKPGKFRIPQCRRTPELVSRV